MRDDSEEVLDWICWALVLDVDNWYPPDETAEETIEALHEGEPDDVEVKEEWERGYHHGAFLAVEDLASTMHAKFGIDVYARAERFQEETEGDFMPFGIDYGDDGIGFLDRDEI